MSELGQDARDFLAYARGAHDAPPDAKGRVHAGLVAALGASGGSGGEPRTASRAGLGARWLTATRVALVAAVVTGGAAVVFEHVKSAREPSGAPITVAIPAALPAPPPVASAAGVPSAPAPSESASSAPRALVPPSAPRPPVRAPQADDATLSVAAEVVLLRKVSDSLRAGDPKGALAAVDEHARRFPNGALAEERETERIVALCALDRHDAAARATARFTRAYPSSSHEARIRAACAPAAAPSGAAP